MNELQRWTLKWERIFEYYLATKFRQVLMGSHHVCSSEQRRAAVTMPREGVRHPDRCGGEMHRRELRKGLW